MKFGSSPVTECDNAFCSERLSIHYYIPVCLLRLNLISDLKVVVAGEGDEEVEKETFAVLIDLWSVVVQACQIGIHAG